MKNHKKLAAFALVAITLIPSLSNAQNLLINGSFELPIASVGTIVGPANTTGLPGWTVGLTSVDVVSQQISAPAFAGTQWLDLDGTPGPGQITQTFATSIGQSYLFSFAYANNVSGSQSVNPGAVVSFAGTDLPAFTINHSTSTLSNFDWTTFSTTFMATDITATLRFTSTSAPGEFGGIALDAVSVVVVPEPTSLSLLGLGIIGLLASRSSRRIC